MDQNNIDTDEEFSNFGIKTHKEIGQGLYDDLKTTWGTTCGAKLEPDFQKSTKDDFEKATSMIADEVKGLFKAHVQISKNGAANGKTTGDSGLTYAGLVKVITIINGIWVRPNVPEEDRLKTIKSLVFAKLNLKFKSPADRADRGQILHITPHSLDCSRAHDNLWILPLAMINDVERGNKESVHMVECRSCKSRILTCFEGDSTTTHEFLTKFIPQTTIEMKTEAKLGPISYWQ